MSDLEKVIKGIKACVNDLGECEYCPYDAGRGKLNCSKRLYADALALLKAQEPRVMTLEEVTNAPEKSVIWLELKPGDKFKNEIYPFVGSGTGWYSCYCSANTSPMFTDEDVEKYGVEFRCWTSRPTDEQREATPWET